MSVLDRAVLAERTMAVQRHLARVMAVRRHGKLTPQRQ